MPVGVVRRYSLWRHDIDADFIGRVVERWRGASMGDKRKVAESMAEPRPPSQRPPEQEKAFAHEGAGALRREPQAGPARGAAILAARPARK